MSSNLSSSNARDVVDQPTRRRSSRRRAPIKEQGSTTTAFGVPSSSSSNVDAAVMMPRVQVEASSDADYSPLPLGNGGVPIR